MTSERLPIWVLDSPQTGSYTSVAGGPLHSQERKALLIQTSEAFRSATDAFDKRLSNYPVDTAEMDFTGPSGWHSLAGELVDTYLGSHRDLLQNDEGYRNAIGGVYDEYRRLVKYIPIPDRTDEEREEVYKQEGQQLVGHAVNEGIFTCMAVYQVLPALVRSARNLFPGKTTQAARRELLSSAQVFSIKMSRHSKSGNDLILKHLRCDTADVNQPIGYETLSFDPHKFRVVARNAGKLTMEASVQSKLVADLNTPFNGCPAFENGSVARINQVITNIIKRDSILEQAGQY